MNPRKLLALGLLAMQGTEVPTMRDPSIVEPYLGERGGARARAKAKRRAKLRNRKALDPATGNFEKGSEI